MKILIAASNMVHINNFHTPYINGLKSLGHDVRIMASGEGADFDIPFQKRTFSVRNLLLIFKIRKIINQEKFDIIYLNTTLAAFFVRLAVLGMKKRPYVVNTVHGYLFDEHTGFIKRKLYIACEKILRRVTDNIVVMNSEDMSVAARFNLCIGKIFEIDGMGVDFDGRKITKEPKTDENINLTFVGEISKRKNQIFLVKAMKKLPEKYSLTLVGDGADRKKTERYIKRNKLSKRVRITGFTNNVYQYLAKTDIYVSASHIEGLPFNIMEAMYAKLPIVASDTKGSRDLLDDRHLYPYNNEDEYIKLLKIVSIADTEYDTERYSLETVFPRNMEIYTSFINDEKIVKID